MIFTSNILWFGVLLDFVGLLRFSSLFFGHFTRELGGGQSAPCPSQQPQDWKICIHPNMYQICIHSKKYVSNMYPLSNWSEKNIPRAVQAFLIRWQKWVPSIKWGNRASRPDWRNCPKVWKLTKEEEGEVGKGEIGQEKEKKEEGRGDADQERDVCTSCGPCNTWTTCTTCTIQGWEWD